MHHLIEHNAKLITELHDRVHEEYRKRPHGPDHHRACKEFHRQYDLLAFPGGYEAGLQKIQDGVPTSIEAALAFLEVRPYFFRSQYMRTKIMRLLGHANLTDSQKERFEKVRTAKKPKAQPSGADNAATRRI